MFCQKYMPTQKYTNTTDDRIQEQTRFEDKSSSRGREWWESRSKTKMSNTTFNQYIPKIKSQNINEEVPWADPRSLGQI